MTGKYFISLLSPISVALEVEPQLKNVVLELTPEASLVGVLPLSADNLECYVLNKEQKPEVTAKRFSANHGNKSSSDNKNTQYSRSMYSHAHNK